MNAQDGQLLAQRARKDPYYQHLADESTALLRAAGCFVESFYQDIRRHPCWNPAMPTTPVSKIVDALQQGSAGHAGAPVVLLATGCFAPVHLGHLAMMETARAALRDAGRWVVGGYLSAAHDEYALSKPGVTQDLIIENRLALLEEAVWPSPWLHVCPWEGRYTPGAVNFTDVLDRLTAYLRKHVRADIEVAYVFGSDNAGFVRAFEHAGLAVCVQRTQQESFPTARTATLQPSRVFFAGPAPRPNASSTSVRDGQLQHLPQETRASYARLRKPAEPSGSSTVADQRPAPLYLLRLDAHHATKCWKQVESSHAERFHVGLVRLLQSALQSTSCQLHTLDVQAQVRIVQALARTRPVLSLDPCVAGTRQLGLSRRFEVCDGQVRSTVMVPRPGCASLQEQLGMLENPPEAWTIVDDDCASGQTRNYVQELLSTAGQAAKDYMALNAVLLQEQGLHHRAIADIVDARDFLLGSQDGGLVVRLADGTLARAPYMLPFVNLMFRAKLPGNVVQALSKQLWVFNAQWFSQVTPILRVRDAANASRKLLTYLGFADADPLERVCQRMADWLSASAADLQPRTSRTGA